MMNPPPPLRIPTIAAYHELIGLAAPAHPLISVVQLDGCRTVTAGEARAFSTDFYSIAMKRQHAGSLKYGQQAGDFSEGVLFFMAPGQVLAVEAGTTLHSGWLLLVHPGLFEGMPLAQRIRRYKYFAYSVREALPLTEAEQGILTQIVQNMAGEYQRPADPSSREILVAQLELLLSYAGRYYQRQSDDLKNSGRGILPRFEAALEQAFSTASLEAHGAPTVQSLAGAIRLSPTYLSSLLKMLTGRGAQQHIQDRLLEAARQQLSTTDKSVGEIAYGLGFGHTQSFNKLFKNKTSVTPLAYRQSFR